MLAEQEIRETAATHTLVINKPELEKATRESIRSSLENMYGTFEELASFDDLLLLDGILEKWRDYVPGADETSRSFILRCISELFTHHKGGLSMPMEQQPPSTSVPGAPLDAEDTTDKEHWSRYTIRDLLHAADGGLRK